MEARGRWKKLTPVCAGRVDGGRRHLSKKNSYKWDIIAPIMWFDTVWVLISSMQLKKFGANYLSNNVVMEFNEIHTA